MTWPKLLALLAATFTASVGSAWTIVGQHATLPHAVSVSRTEFLQFREDVRDDLAEIKADLRVIREAGN